MVEIKSDTNNYEGKALMMVVCNGSTFGHGLIIQPEAKINDGLLSVVILGEISFLDYIRNLKKLKRGQLIQHPEVHYFNAKNVSIEMKGKGLFTEMDGEIFSRGNVNFHVLNNALTIVSA